MSQSICDIEQREDAAVVRVRERKLYQSAVVAFQEQMIQMLDSGTTRVIIDLSGVDIINSSGLGVLILVRDRLDKCGGRMVVIGLRPFMMELFQRMHLDLLFELAGSEEEAGMLLED